MKAVLCESFGPPENLVLKEIDDPVAGVGEAIVEVYAASLNFPDGLQIQGKYQFQPPMPFTPGSEVGGIIKFVGPGLKEFEVGDRVMAIDRKSTRLNSSHALISYAVFCLKKKKNI